VLVGFVVVHLFGHGGHGGHGRQQHAGRDESRADSAETRDPGRRGEPSGHADHSSG
jgi:hypothetical protein